MAEKNGRSFWCKPQPCSLLHEWKVYYDCTAERGMRREKFEESMSVLGSFESFEEWSTHFGCQLRYIANNATLRVFRACVQPVWEDKANSGMGAGKWACLMPNKRSSVSAFQAVLEAMVQGELEWVNGVVLCKRNGQHMVLLWAAGGSSSMEQQRASIRRVLAASLPSQLSFKTHQRARNRNSREEVLCQVQGGRHARTASLEVHCDPWDSDYSPSATSDLSPVLEPMGDCGAAIPPMPEIELGESVPADTLGEDSDDAGSYLELLQAEEDKAATMQAHPLDGDSSRSLARMGSFVDLKADDSLARMGSFVDLAAVQASQGQDGLIDGEIALEIALGTFL